MIFFQQCGILTSVDSDEPVQPPFKLRNSKWCPVSSLTFIEYSSDKQRLWSDCAYAQADLSLCWSHIPHCWKSHALAHIICNSELNSPANSFWKALNLEKNTLDMWAVSSGSTLAFSFKKMDCQNLIMGECTKTRWKQLYQPRCT